MTVTLTKPKAEPAVEETDAARDRLRKLLDQLPAESLPVVEAFLRFLNRQAEEQKPVVLTEPQPAEEKRPSPRYPDTVTAPISALREVIGIMPPVGGDALEDSEALYDGES